MASDGLPDEVRTIGRYQVGGVLGRGALGVTYLAHDPAVDRPVALKLVSADCLGGPDRAEAIGRFRDDVNEASQCTHPNIAAIYDVAVHDGTPFVVMEYVEGVTLSQRHAGALRLDLPELVDIGAQMLAGLSAAHALWLVHRDVRPAKVMLTAGGQVKVRNLGLPRPVTSGRDGMAGYMSPEQCRGEAGDRRSDLFSVAAMLYELATGCQPFAADSAHESRHRLLNDDPPDSAAIRPDIPPAFHAAVRRGLAKDPTARFSTAGAMALAVRRSATAPLRPDRPPPVARPGADATPPPANATNLVLDATVRAAVELSLARHVGPIAAYLLRTALAKADTADALCRLLVVHVDDPADQDRFIVDVRAQLAHPVPSPAKPPAPMTGLSGLPDTELARAQTALTHFMGPIARVLVRRTAPGCADVDTLWVQLARHLDSAGDRAAFLLRL